MRFFWRRATREAKSAAASVLVHEPLLIPAGEFLMGSNRGEDSERPQHRVYLPDYSLDKHPVTVAQYRAFCEATRRQKPSRDNPPHWGWQENHPMVKVTWAEAQAYCDWVGGCLPSEAEWEKAARGPEGWEYPWGDALPDETRCNFDGNVGQTTPVDRYAAGASPYGCLDLAGNVWEWTRSLWGKDPGHPEWGYPYDPRDPEREAREATAKRNRFVLRGGSWRNSSGFCRAACRFGLPPGLLFDSLGFRVVFGRGPGV